jgi:hypothetical protein
MEFPRWYLKVTVDVKVPEHDGCCLFKYTGPFVNELVKKVITITPELACYLVEILESGSPDRGMGALFYWNTCFTCSSWDMTMSGQETLYSYRICRVPKLKVGLDDAVRYMKFDVLLKAGWGNWNTAFRDLHLKNKEYPPNDLVIRARDLQDGVNTDGRRYIECKSL